jgi:MFS family permease
VTSASEAAPPRAREIFSHRPFRLFWAARFCVMAGIQILSISVAWHIYDLTGSAFLLGLTGLVQFLPSLLLILFTGSVSDRYSRRLIMALCIFAEAGCAAALLALTLFATDPVWPIFVVMSVMGVARAFFGPSSQSLLPNLMSKRLLAGAIGLNSSAGQLATIGGPVLGGLLYGVSPETAYGVAVAAFSLGAFLVTRIPKPAEQSRPEPASWSRLFAGFRYVRSNPILLGAISLDLFAVLMGGAVALLPVYARDILDIGPWGLGLLRAAPGIGALATVAYLTAFPITRRSGPIMFMSVGVFGAATVVFGLSTAPWLSVLALIMVGASDMISVYVRMTLVQLATPDEVRGRVNAVNMLFIGASNELGEFRAGSFAAVMGAVPAVVLGGFATIGIAGLWWRLFPQLSGADRLDGSDLPPAPKPGTEAQPAAPRVS